MKNIFNRWSAVAGICTLALLCGANAQASLGVLKGYSGMTLKKSKLVQFRQGKLIRSIGFGKDETAWDRSKTSNFNHLLDIQFGKELNGVPALVVGGGKERKVTDTAWQVETKPLPFSTSDSQFAMSLGVCADYSVSNVKGNSYQTTLRWHDASGTVIKSVPIEVLATQPVFMETQTIGSIPEGAAAFSVTLGFDSPNVDVGHFCAFSGCSLYTINDASPFVPETWFETTPYALDVEDISWKAECPAGTSVRIQIAEADDVDGFPGEWSDFHGPDGTAASFFTKPFKASKKWAKIRVFMKNNGNQCVNLNALTLNGDDLTEWKLYRREVEPLLENLTVSPTHNRREDIVIRVTGMSPVAWKTFSAKIDGTDATAQFTRKGNIITGKAAKDYADGLHKIEISVKDLDGQEAKSVKWLFIGDSPVNVPHVTLRDDGMTLVDGKPMFPIGAYAVWKREFNNNDFDKAFKDLSEAGFNFAHSYNGGADYKAFLDTAHKYGIRIWSSAHNILSEDFKTVRLNHPAVIAWYIGDDTSMNTKPNQLQDRHDALKAIDDHRITTQADGVGGGGSVSHYTDYVRGSDNFLPEIYPVHVDTVEDRGSCVAKVIRDMKVCAEDIDKCGVEHPKSIWPIIQYFQGWTSWKRFPEENEIRAMSFAAVIHGGTGITWYTYGGYHEPKKNRTNYGITSTPERWRIITTITRQLRELEPVLVERTPKEQPEARILAGPPADIMGQPSVTCLLKKHNGETYILAVNSTLETVKAMIPVSGVKAGTVMFEDRDAVVARGSLRDTFKPYDVHIYRLK